MGINSLAELWDAICEDSKNYIGDAAYNAFIKDMYPVKMQDGKLVLATENSWKKETVETFFKEILEKCCVNIVGISLKIEVSVAPAGGEAADKSLVTKKNSIEAIYTFDTFIVGSSNRFAHAASLAVANDPRHLNDPTQKYNPLFIYGNSGVGKTHLMLAIKNKVEEKFPELKVEFIRCEDFTNQVVEALRNKTMDELHQRFRTVDVLLIDDIQFIAGKEQTQVEFFNTFNALYEQNKQIVITSDRPPKDIQTLDERMKNRFESGLLADVNPPDFETRVGIINSKAEQLGITIPEDIVYYIAEQIKTNTRQLEGVVKKIQACMTLNNESVTVSTAQTFIQEVVRDMVPDPITIDRIIDEVSRTYSISRDEILSKLKSADIALARQVAIYVSWQVLNLSYAEIGRAFDKNHTTVLYTIKKMKEIMANDSYQKKLVNDIISNLKD